MATLQRELVLDAPADRVWAAIADFGALHTRVAPGFVLTCVVDDDVRAVTFANGTAAREVRVTSDDTERRFVYCVQSERVRHYNAALVVRAVSEGRTRLTWTIDLLPDGLAPYIGAQMDAAVAAMQPALDRA
jgi:hypothetical protein